VNIATSFSDDFNAFVSSLKKPKDKFFCECLSLKIQEMQSLQTSEISLPTAQSHIQEDLIFVTYE
jgi:hypothetical protein